MPLVERPGREIRKQEIMDAALKVATRDGFQRVTREAVTKAAGCSPRLMNYYYGNVKQLRRDVMRAAIASGHLNIVAQGLALRDRTAMKAPEELKQKAAAALHA